MHRTAEEVEFRSELVLKESSIRLPDVLREDAEECK